MAAYAPLALQRWPRQKTDAVFKSVWLLEKSRISVNCALR
jgi:hypothetical protein